MNAAMRWIQKAFGGEAARTSLSLRARVVAGVALVLAFSSAASAQSLAVKLASIDAGQVLPEGGPAVVRAGAALRAAAARCSGSAETLANSAVSVTHEVLKRGQHATVVDVLEGLDATLVDFESRQDCMRVLASYAAMRKDGYTHSRTVVMQRALLKVLADSTRR